ncbi:hypothetical protein EXN66_Car018687 [Channa argus]|uniref:Uncharacterized protein n=1 Tax=Channa argus TaxID=215402 RepID=A0A6G1QKT7_CHAAH|nr:hypothetical protein EXN66_Car018687 [Channa argus]
MDEPTTRPKWARLHATTGSVEMARILLFSLDGVFVLKQRGIKTPGERERLGGMITAYKIVPDEIDEIKAFTS